MQMLSKDTLRKQDQFLEAYEKCGVITKSAKIVGVSSSTVRNWRRADLIFLERFREATDTYNDHLEEILNDLVDEMHKNLDYKANPTLLIFKMNGAMPEKYKGANQASSEAKDVLSEFRKAMREAKSGPDPKKKDIKVEEPVSAIEEASTIVRGKFGSLNDSDSN
jgi:hypothetical protein